MGTVNIIGEEISLDEIIKNRRAYLIWNTVKIIILTIITTYLFIKALSAGRAPQEVTFIYCVMFGGLLILLAVLIKKYISSRELLKITTIVTNAEYIKNGNGLIVKEVIDNELYNVLIVNLDRFYLISGDRVLVYPKHKG